MISKKAYFIALLLTLPFGIIGGDGPTPEQQQTAFNIIAAIKADDAAQVEYLLNLNPQQCNDRVLQVFEGVSEKCLYDWLFQPTMMREGLKSALLSSISAGLTVAIPTLCEGSTYESSKLEYATMACTGLLTLKHATQAIPSLWKYACYSKYEQRRKTGIAAQKEIQKLIATKKEQK